MAKFTTKQTLSNNGFVQKSGNTMTLSGTTLIGSTGYFEYLTDRSAYYNNRSLVDREFVSNQVNGIVKSALNIGYGEGVYDSKTGTTLLFKSLIGSGGTTITNIGDELRIFSTTGETIDPGSVNGQLLIWSSGSTKWLHSNQLRLVETTGNTNQSNLTDGGNSGMITFYNPTGDTAVTLFTNEFEVFRGESQGLPTAKSYLPQLGSDGFVKTKNNTGELFVDVTDYTSIDNLTAHTSNTSIHFQISGITISESQVTNLVADLQGKSPTGHTHTQYSPTGHTHSESEITNLVADLLGKSGTGHTHTQYSPTGHTHGQYATTVNLSAHTGNTLIHFTQGAIQIGESQVTNLVADLQGKSPTGHTHNEYATSINLDSHTGDTSIHFTQGAIQISESQVTNLVADLQGKSPTGHTHTQYSPTGHTHLQYSSTGHTHLQYSSTAHTHSYTGGTITDLPVLFTGNTYVASGGTRLKKLGNQLTIFSPTGGTSSSGTTQWISKPYDATYIYYPLGDVGIYGGNRLVLEADTDGFAAVWSDVNNVEGYGAHALMIESNGGHYIFKSGEETTSLVEIEYPGNMAILNVGTNSGTPDGGRIVVNGPVIWSGGTSNQANAAYAHSLTPHDSSINGYGFVRASGTTISYDNNTYSTTGHTHSDYQKYLSSGIYTKPTITINTGGTITLGTGQYVLYSNTSFDFPLNIYTHTGGTYSFTDNVTNYVVVSLIAGNAVISVLTDRTTINQSSVHPILTVFREGNEIHYIDWDEMGQGLANKLTDRLARTERFSIESGGLVIGETTGRRITITSGTVWYGATSLLLDSCTSATDLTDMWYHSGGTWTKSIVNTYNNTQYDNGTNLATLGSGKYAVNWVFRGVENAKHIFYVLGTGNYTKSEAEASLIPLLPSIITSQCMLVGRIIVLQGEPSAYQISSAFAVPFVRTPVTAHDELSNVLGDGVYHITQTELNTIKNISGHTGNTLIHYIQGDITISESQVDGLLDDLQNRSLTGHTHIQSEVTNLVGDLAGKAPTIHTHTQYSPTGHTHSESEITNLVTDLAGKSPTGHTHTGTYLPISSYADSKDLTGFVDPDGISVSYDYDSRKITLSGANLDYYWRGEKHTLTSPYTSVSGHSVSTGVKFLSSTNGVDFTWSNTSWVFADMQVAYVYRTASSGSTFCLKETHGMMDWRVHEELHRQLGTYLLSGGKLTAGTYTPNVGDDASVTPGFDQAVVEDEDLETTIPAWIQGTYTTMYVGTGNTSVFSTTATHPFTATAANQYIRVNNVVTGTMSNGVNNRWYNVYQILMPVGIDVNSQKYRMIILQPQVTYTSLAAAIAEDTRSLNLGELTTISPESVIYARITYASTNDSNYGKCRIATGGVTYVVGNKSSQITVAGFTANNHTTLSNLTWLDSAHIGGNSVIAAFDGSGNAVELPQGSYSSSGHTHPLVPVPSNVSGNGTIAPFTAGENLVFGDVCYIKPADGMMWKANATTSATCPGIAMAIATISGSTIGNFLVAGVARNDAWGWTVNGLIWLDTTAGSATQTQPSGTDQAQQILGIATHADRMIFNPQYLFTTHI